MPRQQARKQFLNFVQGLNTESSPLVFPPNTAKDLDNLYLDRDGSLRRRLGINLEEGGGYSTTSFADSDLDAYAISTHEWKSVEGDDSLNFLALQIGGVLYFHTLGADVLSTNVIGSIDLDPLKVRDDFDTFTVDTDVGKGKLFVVSRGISPAYIQYDKDTNTFTGVKLTIKVRDVEGILEERDSPDLFGDDVTPGPQADPNDDNNDVLNPDNLPNFPDFDNINPPSPGY